MNFTVCLAHFCDNHGPTSILCTQAKPISCGSCRPKTPNSSCSTTTASSFEEQKGFAKTLAERRRNPAVVNKLINNPALKNGRNKSRERMEAEDDQLDTPKLRNDGSFDFGDVHESSSSEDAKAEQPSKPALAIRLAPSQNQDSPRSRSTPQPSLSIKSTGVGSECINCRINIPPELSERLPAGSPGSPQGLGPNSRGSATVASSPMLRSKVPVRVYDEAESGYYSDSDSDGAHSQGRPTKSFNGRHYHHLSAGESFDSAISTSSSFHEHMLTFITTHSPLDTSNYSNLRRSIVRTLSGEQLPRGLAGGPIFFGTALDGYTIAYTFRLPDRFARGGRRLYSLIALAGHDTSRAYRAISVCWRHFTSISEWIAELVNDEARVHEHEDQNERPTTSSSQATTAPHTPKPPPPISSLATTRNPSAGIFASSATPATANQGPADNYFTSSRSGAFASPPMGFGPGKAGGASLKGRSLAEMTGDEQCFVKLHMRFVQLLQDLA